MTSRSFLWSLTVATVLLVPAPALAGEVYGKVSIRGASVSDGATVAATCGERSYPARPTDKSGGYHLIVGESGECSLILTYKGASASLDIVTQEDAVQYDIDLEMKDGKLKARRK